MRRFGFLACVTLAVSGCSVEHPTVSSSAAVSAADVSVRVADAEPLIEALLTRYIALTNDIVRGADPATIAEVATAEWAEEERAGFAALDALGGDAPIASVTKFEVASLRGRHTLVDGMVSACIDGGDLPTGVSIHVVPRDGRLVIASITPWEDSTWCADSPSL